MLPQYTEDQKTSTTTSVGSFVAPQSKPAIQETLLGMINKRLDQKLSDDISLKTAEDLTNEKLRLEKIKNELINRTSEDTPVQETTRDNVSKRFGMEVRPSFAEAKYEERLKLLEADLASQINKLQAEIDKVNIEMEKLRSGMVIHQETVINTTNRTESEIQDIVAPQSIPMTEIAQEIITPEKINELPSLLSQTRSSRLMPKSSEPRPRLINGKTNEERMATLAKSETPPVDFIDKSLDIETNLRDVHERSYQTYSDLTDKLIKTKEDAIKIFQNMFSHAPTPTGQQNEQIK